MSVGAAVAIGAVRAYQWTLRPVIGANCRFFPSCSDYAIEAFRTHCAAAGTRRGAFCDATHGVMAAMIRCRQFWRPLGA
jgi:putative component of membrane protein insertase Oxa1/YidC/SpoIIIJ protein YidD